MPGGLGDYSGITRAGSMARRVQYNKDMRRDNGEATVLRLFLMVKRMGERVRSEIRPNVKERIETARPIIVKY
jgi:hypothetical protein